MAVAAMAERGRLSHAAPAPSTEGLPRAFLQSLRTLFDILDDRQRGYVHLREIESRWQGADARELPCGVLEGLRQVAPANGYLTFERFVAGLRTSLLKADGGQRDQARVAARPGDQSSLQQRLMFAPADEPRTVLERKPLPLSACPASGGPSGTSRNPELLCVPVEAASCPTETERPLSKALEQIPSADLGAAACKTLGKGTGEARQAPRARGERRRHTITNGVDCSLLKQMKELDQEQEVLLQGLEMMARGRDWYQQQLQRVQERQRRLSQSRAAADFGAEGSPRPLGRLLPKVQEVARCLGELLTAACSGRVSALEAAWHPLSLFWMLCQERSGSLCTSTGSAFVLFRAPGPSLTLNSSLAATDHPHAERTEPASHSGEVWEDGAGAGGPANPDRLPACSPAQEVTDKSERITQLEQEKSALIKQLFEARALSQQDSGPLDSTFI
ncbi:suppressor APC domain-containing protein 2 isoform X1 [Mus musculus]|uniref:Isoform 3 of Suppressor APC domain-containing protein 2 n=1 Tax=Mus musculus TaxID=10090 RepID=Q9D818-3|nr:suppressor APC domain-containing protein 2 isoform X1 [Mus musculus]|eukprot:XP_006498423.1 PREDICTED: suppressor APC domain-containing protein 2 isoform X1 [Mus musculus]